MPPDESRFRAAVSGLLVIGLGLFGGGLAALILRIEGYGPFLTVGTLMALPFLVLRRGGK